MLDAGPNDMDPAQTWRRLSEVLGRQIPGNQHLGRFHGFVEVIEVPIDTHIEPFSNIRIGFHRLLIALPSDGENIFAFRSRGERIGRCVVVLYMYFDFPP